MSVIVLPHTPVSGQVVPSVGQLGNFVAIRDAFNNTAVQTDVAKTIGVAHTWAADILFTDALYDIGKSGATRPRDIFLSRNLTVGGTAAITGAVTLSSTLAVTGAVTFSDTNGYRFAADAGAYISGGKVYLGRYSGAAGGMALGFDYATGAANFTHTLLVSGAVTLSSTLAVADTVDIGGGTGQALGTGSLDVFRDIGLNAGQGIIVGGARVIAFPSGGQVLIGTTVTLGSSAGDLVLANTKRLMSINAGGTSSFPIAEVNASNVIVLGSSGAAVSISGGLTLTAGFLTLNGNYGAGTNLVTAGAADSAGAGFRVLRVPN